MMVQEVSENGYYLNMVTFKSETYLCAMYTVYVYNVYCICVQCILRVCTLSTAPMYNIRIQVSAVHHSLGKRGTHNCRHP